MASGTGEGCESHGALTHGSVVRLLGLKRSEFNHHVGRVVVPRGNGDRVGVQLHGAVWPEGAGRRGVQHEPIALRRENLRLLRLPLPAHYTSLPGSVPVELTIRSAGDSGWALPENVLEQIAEFLRVRRVEIADVSVTGCSSTRGDFPLQAALSEAENEWWISGAGTMPNGVGSEYLEFSFGRRRAITFVGLKIPALPNGPLSVRHFHLLASPDGAGAWAPVAADSLETLDRSDVQEFALVPPVEAQAMRLVCTRNAAAASHPGLLRADCIGLFQVLFA